MRPPRLCCGIKHTKSENLPPYAPQISGHVVEEGAGHLYGQRRTDTSEFKFLLAQHVCRPGFGLIVGHMSGRVLVGKLGLKEVDVDTEKHGYLSRRRQFCRQL